MLDSDPRHGTYAGYAAHYTDDGGNPCDPCREAGKRRRKRNKYLAETGNPATLPVQGVVRRCRALMAIGYTLPQIAAESGLHLKTLRNPIYRSRSVYRATHEAVADAYERLCMTLPPEETTQQRRDSSYVRNLARRRGWAPPLAWDDIDADESPRGVRQDRPRSHTHVDPVHVERILGGDWASARDATKAERVAVCTAWLERDLSLNELERLTGWKADRYVRKGDAA